MKGLDFVKMKYDQLIILLSFITELFSMIIIKYEKIIYISNPTFKIGKILLRSNEANLIYYMSYIFLHFFYLYSIIYIIIIIYYFKQNINIKLKRNSILILVLFICDLVLYFFDIERMVKYSDSLRFIIICLLTNLVVYIKYKKNNIKIK